MISTIALLSISSAIVLAHPPIFAHIHEAVGNLVKEVDSKLTSKPILKITKPLEDVAVEAGEPVIFQCEALFTPSAVIYWEKNGVRIQGDRDLNIKEKMLNMGKPIVESGIVASTLTIPCAEAKDSNEYQCVAFNGYTTVKSSAQLRVEGRGQCKNHRTPLTITQWSDSRFEMEGNSATLMCRTNQFSEKAWLFEDDAINTNGGRYQVQSNGDLLIKNIVWEDMGTYTCIASNEQGEDRADTFLYPTKKKSI